MQINVTGLKDDGDFIVVSEDLAQPISHDLPGVEKLNSPLHVEVTVTKSDKGYIVQGKFQVDLQLICNRCLTTFNHLLVAELIDEYVSARQESSDNELDVLLNEPNISLRGNMLDISGLIDESLLLSIPMKATCQENCQGICPECGQILNEKTCQCDISTPDPRLAPLADLFKKD